MDRERECQISVVAELVWGTAGSFGCECDQRLEAVEQHDNPIVTKLEQRVGEIAFNVGIAARIVDHVSGDVTRDGVVHGAKRAQVNYRKLRVLVVLKSGRTALK